jgi:cyclopentanol dehydrogenase
MARLAGRVAVVTGGALGLGFATSRLLAQEGAKLVVADRDHLAGQDASDRIKKDTGAETMFVPLDVASEELWAAAMAAVTKRFGRLDILVNNAGIYLSGSTESTSLEDWERTFSVNVRGVFLGSRAAIPLMRENGGGSIVNISSNWGIVAFPDAAAYVASKGAVRLLTKATASEVAQDGIRVNSVHPSLTATNMTRGLLEDPVATKKLLGPSLLGRPAKAEEVAQTILFLASDQSSFMTGSELVVDGGYTAV